MTDGARTYLCERPTRAATTAEESVMIRPHQTGHAFARDGSLLRVDVIADRWVAARFTPTLSIAQQFVGSDEAVHQQITHWM